MANVTLSFAKAEVIGSLHAYDPQNKNMTSIGINGPRTLGQIFSSNCSHYFQLVTQSTGLGVKSRILVEPFVFAIVDHVQNTKKWKVYSKDTEEILTLEYNLG